MDYERKRHAGRIRAIKPQTDLVHLYRLECPRSKTGPYTTLEGRVWFRQDHSNPSSHPNPYNDGLPVAMGDDHLCACTLEQFTQWFTAEEVEACTERGLQLLSFKVDALDVYVLHRQCVFQRDAERIDLTVVHNWRELYAH